MISLRRGKDNTQPDCELGLGDAEWAKKLLEEHLSEDSVGGRLLGKATPRI
jgi:hypothetical protein